MHLCMGTFLTALKMCKAASTKQKKLGEAVFRALCPTFDCGDDDSAISAVFRGRRNINSYLQIMIGDLSPAMIANNFNKEVIPLLDDNKSNYLVRLIQNLIATDSIDCDCCVEMVNQIQKKDFIILDRIVLKDFLAGVCLYVVKNTDNLNKVNDVHEFIEFAKKAESEDFCRVSFITSYSASKIFCDNKARPIAEIYKNAGTVIDAVSTDIFKLFAGKPPDQRIILVIPVNTTFETKFEARIGNAIIPLVSEKTLHGRWIKYMQETGVEITDVDIKIDHSLRNHGLKKCAVRGTAVGKQDVYPIGTIAEIINNQTDYYLVAISEFDEKNRAYSDITHINRAINAIINYYDEEGQGYDLYIPLLGTGRSRTGLSIQESYDLLKKTILERIDDIYGRIHLVIHPEQIDEIKMEG